ncbi:Tol-Pal system beta propeller repeat protein TolB [Halorhodospira sp. M39old]|uniref:Tol-Pal system beta propeller repeat protein TolB n=1 Tax=Halorhodospira sp. M39old TaxID=2899131 RepID=UPI001EE828B5|nr:Tol-Pal system beta propeller repeat protein TolB [Halorhodospira sp. M38]
MTRLNRVWSTVYLAALLMLPGQASADDVVIDIIGGIEGATPIAVVPFQRADGADPETGIAPIITANLARTGRFDVLPEDDLVATPGRMEDVRFSTWRAQGVDHLVVGGIDNATDGRYEVRFELLDAFQGQRTDGRRYRAEERHLRTLAHTISDRIYEAITDREGTFTKRIAYVAVEQREDGEGRQHRLVVADSDGHRPQTILTSDEPLLSPAWSPSRDRLAYVSFEGRRSEVFVQEIRTGEREQVASFRGINSAPAWSPDGDRLAVTLSRDGAANIYLIDLASGEVRPVTDHWAIDTEATWGPDGEWIYFTSDRGGRPQIYRTTPDGGETERVTYEGAYNARPSISPDGERMAMVHRHDGQYYIALQDLETEAVQIISDGPADESPSFAPNGDLVIYTAGGTEGQRLATASVIGGAVAPLESTERPDTRVREPAW